MLISSHDPTVDLDSLAIAVRLGAALVAGAVIGIDRELKNKPAGLRTHAMVSIGAAIVVLATVASSHGSADAVSRAIQGIITGIGFLGAGLVELVGIAIAAAILVLVGGNWIEGALGRRGESKLLDTPPDGDRRGK